MHGRPPRQQRPHRRHIAPARRCHEPRYAHTARRRQNRIYQRRIPLTASVAVPAGEEAGQCEGGRVVGCQVTGRCSVNIFISQLKYFAALNIKINTNSVLYTAVARGRLTYAL